MKELRLADHFGDGMILKCGTKIRIWGYDEPDRNVMVSFLGEEYVSRTGQDGIWEVWMQETTRGGPNTMYISDEQGEEVVIGNIMIDDCQK